MSNWKDLEQIVFDILKQDDPVLPKGSGSSKKEEDVVSKHIVAQCKYTDNINMSILQKDIERLLEASDSLDKFPLFINGNNKCNLLSIPITLETEIFIKLFIYIIQIKKILGNINNTKTTDLTTLQILNNELKKSKSLMYRLNEYINKEISNADNKLDTMYKKLTICDLFENEN